MKAGVVLLMLAATVLATSAADAARSGGTCNADQLKATFTPVQGSKTNSVIDYSLRITNKTGECAVTGPPLGQLLGASGRELPTRIIVAKAQPLYIFLRAGQSAQASAIITRTPGRGEPSAGCEPVAYAFRLRSPNGSGNTVVPLRPHIRVCRHGLLQFTSWGSTP